MISRRRLLSGFLSASVSGLVQAAESTFSEGCYDPTGKPTPPHEKDLWPKRLHTPAKLANENFWGYRPTKTPKMDFLSAQMRSTAYGMMMLMQEDKLFAMPKVKVQKYCGDTNEIFSSFNLSYPGDMNDRQLADLMKQIQNTPAELRMLSPEQRFFNVLNNLVGSFAKALYKLHTDWGGIPKSLTQLFIDDEGDCKDFAMARYMYARFMGVPKEDLAVMLYYDGTGGNVGHANLAVYNEKWGWVIVDGTGRSEDQIYGSNQYFQNAEFFKDALKGSYLGEMVPIAAVTPDGIMMYDAIHTFLSDGTPMFKRPDPIPRRTKQFLAYWDEGAFIPSYEGPDL
jgi:hypothetical protein